MELKYIFGPVPSRRLGKSLGISPIPRKTCNYSCIYCQLGRTDKMTGERKEFFPLKDIINEFKEYLKESFDFDVVTIVGEGEPTLYSKLGELIKEVKKITDKPVAVITNGALLSSKEVRDELMNADIVLPSIDGYNEETAKKIDRPLGTIHFKDELEGLIEFSKEYKGQLLLEIMLISEINCDKNQLNGEIINNIVVYKARTLATNEDGIFEPLYKTITTTYIERVLRYMTTDFKEDKIWQGIFKYPC